MGAVAAIFWESQAGTGTRKDPQIAISSHKKAKKKKGGRKMKRILF